jgi:energy-coupling factor transporter ATP-binding protein EcfA2
MRALDLSEKIVEYPMGFGSDHEEIHCPYPGLRPFQEHETDLFFGRDSHVAEILNRMRKNRFIAITGPSGCGKSSLIRAGVLPALREGFLTGEQDEWRFAVLRPGGQPMRNLATALLTCGIFNADGDQSETASAQTPKPDLVAVDRLIADLLPGPKRLGEFLAINNFAQKRCLLILVDQFEELFRFSGSSPSVADMSIAQTEAARKSSQFDEARTFVRLLLNTVERTGIRAYVIITMRTDFLGECTQFAGLPEKISVSQYLTPRLTREQTREAILGPARMHSCDVESEVVNEILNEMGNDPDQLPLMQNLLMQMWLMAEQDAGGGNTRPQLDTTTGGSSVVSGKKLTRKHFLKAGRLSGAIGMQAESWRRNPTRSAAELAAVEHIFRQVSDVGDAGQLIRRTPPPTWQKIIETAPQQLRTCPNQALHKVLADFSASGMNFLYPQIDSEKDIDRGQAIDLSHESVIRNWQAVGAWARDEKKRTTLIRERERDTAAWVRDRRRWSELGLTPQEIADCLDLQKVNPDCFSPDARTFISRSRWKQFVLRWFPIAVVVVVVLLTVYLRIKGNEAQATAALNQSFRRKETRQLLADLATGTLNAGHSFDVTKEFGELASTYGKMTEYYRKSEDWKQDPDGEQTRLLVHAATSLTLSQLPIIKKIAGEDRESTTINLWTRPDGHVAHLLENAGSSSTGRRTCSYLAVGPDGTVSGQRNPGSRLDVIKVPVRFGSQLKESGFALLKRGESGGYYVIEVYTDSQAQPETLRIQDFPASTSRIEIFRTTDDSYCLLAIRDANAAGGSGPREQATVHFATGKPNTVLTLKLLDRPVKLIRRTEPENASSDPNPADADGNSRALNAIHISPDRQFVVLELQPEQRPTIAPTPQEPPQQKNTKLENESPPDIQTPEPSSDAQPEVQPPVNSVSGTLVVSTTRDFIRWLQSEAHEDLRGHEFDDPDTEFIRFVQPARETDSETLILLREGTSEQTSSRNQPSSAMSDAILIDVSNPPFRRGNTWQQKRIRRREESAMDSGSRASPLQLAVCSQSDGVSVTTLASSTSLMTDGAIIDAYETRQRSASMNAVEFDIVVVTDKSIYGESFRGGMGQAGEASEVERGVISKSADNAFDEKDSEPIFFGQTEIGVEITRAALSPNRQILALACRDSTLRLYDVHRDMFAAVPIRLPAQAAALRWAGTGDASALIVAVHPASGSKWQLLHLPQAEITKSSTHTTLPFYPREIDQTGKIFAGLAESEASLNAIQTDDSGNVLRSLQVSWDSEIVAVNKHGDMVVRTEDALVCCFSDGEERVLGYFNGPCVFSPESNLLAVTIYGSLQVYDLQARDWALQADPLNVESGETTQVIWSDDERFLFQEVVQDDRLQLINWTCTNATDRADGMKPSLKQTQSPLQLQRTSLQPSAPESIQRVTSATYFSCRGQSYLAIGSDADFVDLFIVESTAASSANQSADSKMTACRALRFPTNIRNISPLTDDSKEARWLVVSYEQYSDAELLSLTSFLDGQYTGASPHGDLLVDAARRALSYDAKRNWLFGLSGSAVGLWCLDTASPKSGGRSSALPVKLRMVAVAPGETPGARYSTMSLAGPNRDVLTVTTLDGQELRTRRLRLSPMVDPAEADSEDWQDGNLNACLNSISTGDFQASAPFLDSRFSSAMDAPAGRRTIPADVIRPADSEEIVSAVKLLEESMDATEVWRQLEASRPAGIGEIEFACEVARAVLSAAEDRAERAGKTRFRGPPNAGKFNELDLQNGDFSIPIKDERPLLGSVHYVLLQSLLTRVPAKSGPGIEMRLGVMRSLSPADGVDAKAHGFLKTCMEDILKNPRALPRHGPRTLLQQVLWSGGMDLISRPEFLRVVSAELVVDFVKALISVIPGRHVEGADLQKVRRLLNAMWQDGVLTDQERQIGKGFAELLLADGMLSSDDSDDALCRAFVVCNLGLDKPFSERAVRMAERNLQRAERRGVWEKVAWTRNTLGFARIRSGEYDAAVKVSAENQSDSSVEESVRRTSPVLPFDSCVRLMATGYKRDWDDDWVSTLRGLDEQSDLLQEFHPEYKLLLEEIRSLKRPE